MSSDRPNCPWQQGEGVLESPSPSWGRARPPRKVPLGEGPLSAPEILRGTPTLDTQHQHPYSRPSPSGRGAPRFSPTPRLEAKAARGPAWGVAGFRDLGGPGPGVGGDPAWEQGDVPGPEAGRGAGRQGGVGEPRSWRRWGRGISAGPGAGGEPGPGVGGRSGAGPGGMAPPRTGVGAQGRDLGGMARLGNGGAELGRGWGGGSTGRGVGGGEAGPGWGMARQGTEGAGRGPDLEGRRASTWVGNGPAGNWGCGARAWGSAGPEPGGGRRTRWGAPGRRAPLTECLLCGNIMSVAAGGADCAPAVRPARAAQGAGRPRLCPGADRQLPGPPPPPRAPGLARFLRPLPARRAPARPGPRFLRARRPSPPPAARPPLLLSNGGDAGGAAAWVRGGSAPPAAAAAAAARARARRRGGGARPGRPADPHPARLPRAGRPAR